MGVFQKCPGVLEAMQILGFMGVALIVLCILPQVIKILRTRQVRDIRLPFWILMVAGLLFQLPQALGTKDPGYITGIVLSFSLSLITLLFVWKFK